MTGRLFIDAVELIKMRARRRLVQSAFLIAVAGALITLDWGTSRDVVLHPDSIMLVVALLLADVVLGRASVQLDRGRLTLSALAIGPATLLLNPLNASVVGLSVGLTVRSRGSLRVLTNALLSATYAALGAALAVHVFGNASLSLLDRLLVLIAVWVTSWILFAASFAIFTGDSLTTVVRRNFTGSFYAAYAYFTLGSLLVSYVLDGSLLGYVLAAIAWILAFALTDTIAGRRVRRVLESELSDADRHLFHSRAVEGVVHNLRNHMATAVGYLKEIDTRHLDSVERDAIETARAAANDAVTVLQSLSQGATPRVTYAPEPIDLNELVSRALDMARPRARPKHIELGLHETPEDVKVKADPLLLREVATNLVNNAIDAAPENGHVELSTGRRNNGHPYFSVSDNGQGVAEEDRHHLFEPHFTTKENGTGLGLFMSYGIVREHQGQLIYEGNRRGAVFTVVLPPYGR